MFTERHLTEKYTKGKTNTCQYLLIHHTGGTGFNNQVNYLCYHRADTVNEDVSCHVVIGERGQVAKIALDDQVTRHAGRSAWDGKVGMNYYSIGIEVVSDGYKFTSKQKKALNQVIRYYMDLYKIPAENVIRHRDVSPNRKRDPGDNLWNRLYSTWSMFQQSFTNAVKKGHSAIYYKLLKRIEKRNSAVWENTTNECERDVLHNFNEHIREFLEYYGK